MKSRFTKKVGSGTELLRFSKSDSAEFRCPFRRATDLDASVICAPTDLAKLRNATTDAGFEVETAELTYIPNQTQEIADEEVVQQFQDFLEELEDNEDVQRFFHNAELPDDEDDE